MSPRFHPGKRNSGAEFERTVLSHLDASYNLARWILGDAHDAEDAVQDAAIRAFDAFPTFRGSDAKPWFLAIVRNGCMNRIRQRKDHRNLDWAAESSIDERSSPEQLVIKAWEAEAVQTAVAALPVDQREIVVLREFEDLSYKEIASVTGLPIGTVMSRLARARSRLQVLLTEGACP